MFKGINFSQFLSEHTEFHALVDGFGFVMCPFFLAIHGIREELLNEIVGELHYFIFGGFLGVWTWIGIIALLAKIVL